MTLFLRLRGLLDRRVLGGRLYLGSTLWAAAHFGLGLLLWGLGSYLNWSGLPPGWTLATLTVVCLAILFRRSAPGTGLAVATAALAADAVAGPSLWVFVAYGELLYAMGAWGRRRPAYVVFAVVIGVGIAFLELLLLLLPAGWLKGGLLTVLQGVGVYALLFLTPMTTGLSIREYRLRAETERRRAQQIARMAELDRGSAVAEERGRMARELHDVIANHLSAIAVQSTAALSMRDLEPERVRQVLAVVRDSSVQGLAEMRQMISVLRADDALDLEHVTPRLSEADRLVETARRAGLDVRLTERGRPGALPAQVDAAAYRILQESLTNALRYADPRRVDITVEHPADAGEECPLVLTAENEAAAQERTWPDGVGGGAGLTGMRERAVLLGGAFSAGPAEGGRVWRVRAELPVPAAEGGTADADGPGGVEIVGTESRS